MTEMKKWPKFSGEKIDIVKSLLQTGESMNLDNFIAFFTDNALYQFSNFPVVYGPEGIREASLDFLKKVEGLHHHIKDMWETEDGTIICEMDISYIRYDGKVFTLPCNDFIRLRGDKIQELYIYMDIRPVFETPEATAKASTEETTGAKLGDIVKDLFAAALANDLDKYVTFFTDDAIYKAGLADSVIGPQGIREFALPVMKIFDTVAHDIKNMWEIGDTVFCQAEVLYNRRDGKVFKIPTSNIIRFKGDKIRELQAFGDPSSAFA